MQGILHTGERKQGVGGGEQADEQTAAQGVWIQDGAVALCKRWPIVRPPREGGERRGRRHGVQTATRASGGASEPCVAAAGAPAVMPPPPAPAPRSVPKLKSTAVRQRTGARSGSRGSGEEAARQSGPRLVEQVPVGGLSTKHEEGE